MLRPSLILLPLAVVAACASPLERCLSDANRQLNTLDRLIAVTQGNINRGFAIFETEDVRVVRRTCTDERDDGTEFQFRCDRTETFTRREPVSINVAEERISCDNCRSGVKPPHGKHKQALSNASRPILHKVKKR